MTSDQFISVAMCTYNGARYLQEQLESILEQTRLPGEIIICDDGSMDETMLILDKFKEKAPFSVNIRHNEIRLGSTKNFEKAIALCTGNVIVLADQDDVWLPEKLERIEQAFVGHPNAGYVFSDALVVDEELRSLGYTMWGQALFTNRERRRFETGHQIEILLKHNVVTGATMAFRKGLKKLILPIPGLWIHDAWISFIGSAVGETGILIREPLIKYRQHAMQAIGGRKLSKLEQLNRARSVKAETYSNAEARLLEVLDRIIIKKKCDECIQISINRKIQHLKVRQTLYGYSLLKRVRKVLQELVFCRYHKFSNGLKSAAKDAFLIN